MAVIALAASNAQAEIRYDSAAGPLAGQLIPGTEGITPAPGVDLSGWNGAGHTLQFAALSGVDLHASSLVGSNLTDSELAGANLTGANLTLANFTGANLTRAACYSTNFNGANLTGTNLTDALLQDATVAGAVIKGTNFSSSTPLPFAALSSDQLYSTASYQNHDLSGIILNGGNISGLDFSNQNLSGASLANCNQIPFGFFPGANFNGADLTSANLSYSRLSGSSLVGARLTNTNLTGVSFSLTNLDNADFTGAIVRGVDFSTGVGFAPSFTAAQLYTTASYVNHDLRGIRLGSDELIYDLSGWNFANQNLADAALTGSKLTGANFSGAIITGADFSNGLTTESGGNGALTADQLYSTASYANHDLSRIKLQGSFMREWNFSFQDLTGADLSEATVHDAVFTGAIIKGVDFGARFYQNPVPGQFGLSAQQLYSTTSYASGDLSGVGFYNDFLIGWNLTNMNLAGANLVAKLTNTNLSGADLRGGGWTPDATTIVHNTIRPDGSINGLALLPGEKLIVHNNAIAVAVALSATVDPAAGIEFRLEDKWTSPVGFFAGVVPSLNGTLELTIASGIDPAMLVGETFQLFRWNGPLPANDRFATIATAPGLSWDTSALYTDGTVTLTAVPEPPGVLAFMIGAATALAYRRSSHRGNRAPRIYP